MSRLLTHYWTPDDTPERRHMQAQDWLRDLREFPVDIVEAATDDWRRSQTRKPYIVDIRKACIAAQRERTERAARQRRPALDREAYAREMGFSSSLERQDAIRRQKHSYRLAEQHRALMAAKGLDHLGRPKTGR